MNRSRALLVLTVLLAAAVAQLSGANPAGAITPTFTPDTLTSNHLYSLTKYVDGEAVAWADYNGDGNLDLLVTPGSSGGTGGYASGTYLYKGDGLGGFTEDTTAEANLADVSSGAVAWGDYNGDGKPDILLTGLSFATTGHPSTPVAKLYKQNSSGVYVEDTVADASLTGVSPSSVAWGDYNNDGRPDILLSGTNASGKPTLKLYTNNGDGTFTEDTSAGLTWDTSTEVFPGLVNGSVAWGDYDNDGYLDILVTGFTGSSGDSIHPARVAKILHNNGDGTFSEDKTADPSLTPVEESAAAWGDYNNDGWLDILLSGCDNSSGSCASVVSKVYTNNGPGAFSQALPTASLQGSKDGGDAWGDYNSDGKPDILLSGDDAGTHPLYGKAYANTGSPGFTVDPTGFLIQPPGTTGPGTAAFGDYDNDGRLDAVLAGSFKTNIFQNTSSAADTAPTVPASPTFSRGSTSATFSWTASTDTQQPSAGLTYNLRVGTTPGGSDVVPSMSLSSGKRLVPAPGNVGEATSYTLTGLTPGVPYYWSVQAVDASFMASAFSTEQVFALGYGADSTTFPGIEGGSVAFGDYNSDGQLDAVVTGTDSSGAALAKVYQRFLVTQLCTPPPFPVCHPTIHHWVWEEDTSANLTAVSDSSAAWGDYNNDGHLDLLIAGMHGSTPTTTLYTGNGTGAFTADTSASFVGVLRGAVAFVDYNSDGRPDVLVTGWDNVNSPGHTYAKLYRNNGGGSFSEDTTAEASLAGVNFSSIAVGDYNRDGRPDLLISGSTAPNSSSPVTINLYRNNGNGTFTDVAPAADLYTNSSSNDGVVQGTVAWGDYNSDGWPDILASGNGPGGSGSTKVFKNNGNGTFTQDAIATALPWQQQSGAAWGDYNADGKPDILLAGLNNYAVPISAIYENQGSGAFADIGAGLTGVTFSSAAWGDYNADGKLDALVAGCTVGTGGGCTDSSDTTTLYTSSVGTNAAPAAPSGLSASFASGIENLSWSAPTDDHTASAALSYNLRVGISSGGTQIVSPLSRSAGTRLVPQDGNVGERTSYGLTGLTPGTTYYWSVQAVDSGFAGSAFATEGTFTVPESFAFSAAAYSVGEGGGSATVTINRSGYTAGAASVHFATANGTATAGSDYTAVSQTVSFAAGQTSKTVSIPIIDDSVVESNETVSLSLSSPSSGATLGTPHAATLTIQDNDRAFAFSSSTYSVNEGGGAATVTINRSGATAAYPDSVHFATANGTATAGSDYTAVSQTVSFAAGQTSKTVSIPIIDDISIEPPETVLLSLTSPSSGATLGTPHAATLTIVDNDRAFTLSSATYSVNEGAGSAAITIKRTGLTSGADSVHFATANGTATAGSDYTAVSQTVSFAAGQSSKTVSIPITNDSSIESSETVLLSLSSPSAGATLGNPHAATLTIVDNDRAFAFSAASYSAGEGAGSAVITIKRTGLTSGADSVHFATANGTATAGSDYTAVSQTVSFAAGQSSKTVSIPITDDSAVESSETVQLSLSSPSAGATLGTPHAATLTITDNDVTAQPAAKTKGKLVSAKLSKKSFKSSQARKVKLTCKFSPKSKVFKYVLSIKKGKKWQAVKRVSKTGFNKLKYTLSVKKLFAGKAIKRGSYRLKLSADTNSKTLRFTVR